MSFRRSASSRSVFLEALRKRTGSVKRNVNENSCTQGIHRIYTDVLCVKLSYSTISDQSFSEEVETEFTEDISSVSLSLENNNSHVLKDLETERETNPKE